MDHVFHKCGRISFPDRYKYDESHLINAMQILNILGQFLCQMFKVKDEVPTKIIAARVSGIVRN